MSSRSRSYTAAGISALLLGGLVYTAVYLYRYVMLYDDLLQIPQQIVFPFLLRIFLIFFVVTVSAIILLSRDRSVRRNASDAGDDRPKFSLDVFDGDAQQPTETGMYDLDGMPERAVRADPEYEVEIGTEPVGEDAEDDIETVFEAGEEDPFMVKLRQEVEYSSENTYELSLVLMNILPGSYSSDFSVFSETVEKFFSDSAFLYPYRDEHSLILIMPFYSFTEVQKELAELHESLKKELEHRSTLLRAGFTSKFSRYINAETLLYECEIAYNKALEEDDSCILGFEPDIDKYSSYYSS